jgi:hypothetical protein
MTAFTIDLNTDQPDVLHVDVANRFKVAIERTEAGLSLRVYPRTVGVLWDAPFGMFEVDEAELAALEGEMEDA